MLVWVQKYAVAALLILFYFLKKKTLFLHKKEKKLTQHSLTHLSQQREKEKRNGIDEQRQIIFNSSEKGS